MLRIRLRRVGKKKQPMYRIVVADSHKPRDGAFVENLGYYHPMDNPSTIVLDEERAKHWLARGAQPSDRVAKILKIQGLAEIPAKLATRIALGEERAKEASKAKAEKEAATEEPAAKEAAAPEAKETTAEEPKAEAAAAEPAAEAAAAAEPEAKDTAAEAAAPEAKESKAEEPAAKEAAPDAAPAEEAAPDNKEKTE